MTVAHLTKRSSKKTSGIARGFLFFATHSYFLLFFLLLSIFSAGLSSCSTAVGLPDRLSPYPLQSYIPDSFSWTAIEGCGGNAWYASFENRQLPLRYHCVKINLSSSALFLTAFPGGQDDFLPSKTGSSRLFIGKRTPAFARESGVSIAINTAPFAGKSGHWDFLAHLTRTRQIAGTHIVSGRELASPQSRFCALCLFQKKQGFTASIVDSQTGDSLLSADYAFGGFWTILRDGSLRNFAVIRDSRTACGVSADGSILYLLVVEGERKGKSAGLTYMECGEIFKALGAATAMEFDGGGSSSLVINGRNMLSYPVLRINAASLGFSFFIDD